MPIETVSAIEAARRLSDLLNRVFYRGDSFAIVRNGQEVARLVPAERRPHLTVGELIGMVREVGPVGDELAADIERIQAEQPSLPDDPWRP